MLHCGSVECEPGQVCCHGGSSPQGDDCRAPGSCGNDSEVSCLGPSSCPGEVCCAVVGGPDIVDSVSCQPSCDGPNEVIMCTGDDTVCDVGETCVPSTVLGAPYEYCSF